MSEGSMAGVQVVHLVFAIFSWDRYHGIALYIDDDREKQLNALKISSPRSHEILYALMIERLQ